MLRKIYFKVNNKISDRMAITINYIKVFKKLPNVKKPTTFAEKIHVIKISHWLEQKSDYVDKFKVREIIKKRIGKEYLTDLYGVYTDFSEADFKGLPNSFVIKLNNGCGCNLVVKNKEEITYEEVIKKIKEWYKIDFYKKTREKQYKNVKNVIICEEYLEDKYGNLYDYKFFVLGGKVRVIQVDIMEYGKKRDFYDCDWNKLKLSKGVPNSSKIIEKPYKLEEMINLAEKLAVGVELLRVDFYYVDDKIYFGELTFTPANGTTPFQPKEADLKLASFINLEKQLKEVHGK